MGSIFFTNEERITQRRRLSLYKKATLGNRATGSTDSGENKRHKGERFFERRSRDEEKKGERERRREDSHIISCLWASFQESSKYILLFSLSIFCPGIFYRFHIFPLPLILFQLFTAFYPPPPSFSRLVYIYLSSFSSSFPTSTNTHLTPNDKGPFKRFLDIVCILLLLGAVTKFLASHPFVFSPSPPCPPQELICFSPVRLFVRSKGYIDR